MRRFVTFFIIVSIVIFSIGTNMKEMPTTTTDLTITKSEENKAKNQAKATTEKFNAKVAKSETKSEVNSAEAQTKEPMPEPESAPKVEPEPSIYDLPFGSHGRLIIDSIGVNVALWDTTCCTAQPIVDAEDEISYYI